MSWSEEINSQANQLQIAELQRLVERLNSENSRLNNENETLNHENQQLLNQLKVLNVLQSQQVKIEATLAQRQKNLVRMSNEQNTELKTLEQELNDSAARLATSQTQLAQLQEKLDNI